MHLTYILVRVHATKENVSIYEEYNKEQVDLILENFVVYAKCILANTIEGKEERIAPQSMEALEVIIIRMVASKYLQLRN